MMSNVVAIRNITAIGDVGCILSLKQLYAYLPHAFINEKKQRRRTTYEISEAKKCMLETRKNNREVKLMIQKEQRNFMKQLSKTERTAHKQMLRSEFKAQLIKRKELQQLMKSERIIRLKKQKERLPIEVKYNEYRFNGLILRILYPVKATMLVFRTGKIICLGTKSLKELEEAGRYFTHILFMHGYQPVFSGFTVKNMVGSWSIDYQLNIQRLHSECGGMYEPERFPALQYYIDNVTLLIFTSGKVIATGAKRQEELNTAHRKFIDMLSSGVYLS